MEVRSAVAASLSEVSLSTQVLKTAVAAFDEVLPWLHI